MSIKAVVFDFDDTLVNTKVFVLEHLKNTLEKLDLQKKEESLQQAKQILGQNLSFENFFEKVFNDQWEDVLKAYREDATETEYTARTGMLEYVNNLEKENILRYILTNRDNIVELRLKQAGFDPDQFIRYRAPEGHKKPDSQAYSEVIKDIQDKGIEKEEVLIVGNHPDDYFGLPEDWREQFRAFPESEESQRKFLEIENIKRDQIYDEIFKIN